MLIMRKRQSIFDKHPDGARLLEEIITGKVTKSQAAKILGCSKSNITQYMQRHQLQVQDNFSSLSTKKAPLDLTKSRPKSKSKQKSKSPTKANEETPLNPLAEQTITLTDDQLKYLSPANLKTIQQSLLDKALNGEIELTMSEFTTLCREIRYNFELQLKYNLAEKKEEQIIKLDEEDVNKIFADMEEFCSVCPYHQEFIRRKNEEQTKARLASE